MDTTVDGFELKLDGETFGGVNASLTFEIRENFDGLDRAAVFVSEVEGKKVVTIISWERFADSFDGMRARMMSEDWDEALIQLTEGSS